MLNLPKEFLDFHDAIKLDDKTRHCAKKEKSFLKN